MQLVLFGVLIYLHTSWWGGGLAFLPLPGRGPEASGSSAARFLEDKYRGRRRGLLCKEKCIRLLFHVRQWCSQVEVGLCSKGTLLG